MKYTIEHMQNLYQEINFQIFEDKLPEPAFFLLDDFLARKLYDFPIDGICIPAANGYIIGVHIDLTPIAFYNTMVHELIHVYCMEKWNYSGHGKKFKKICKKSLDILYHI